jgi:hypothetical protein
MKIKEEIDKIIVESEDAAKKWVIKTNLNLEERVHKVLEKDFQYTILKVIGLDDHWGKWEVDHCNGRAGQSSVGDYIKDTAQHHIKSYINKHIKKLPPLPKQAIDSIKRDYIEQVIRELRDLSREEAMKTAKKLYYLHIKPSIGIDEPEER